MSDTFIDARLTIIEHKIDQLLALLRGSASPSGKANGQRNGGNVASDQDLDSDKGNPKVYKDPPAKYWGGTSYAGFHLSDVSDPAYLDALAKYFDSCAFMAARDVANGVDVERNEKTVRFKPLDAARCRGWAARLRARGVTAPTANGGSSTEYTTTDEEIPF